MSPAAAGLAGRGPSPLARGNHQGRSVNVDVRGPIPARAGQPVWQARRRLLVGAHPRSRGATHPVAIKGVPQMGPSPLARGNRNSSCHFGFGAGPIPARAGQPGPRHPGARRPRAHPRSRGATITKPAERKPTGGPSPLARGNRRAVPQPCVGLRPIPARAGQPDSCVHTAGVAGAHPRSRGATVMGQMKALMGQGPSPLARGNRG